MFEQKSFQYTSVTDDDDRRHRLWEHPNFVIELNHSAKSGETFNLMHGTTQFVVENNIGIKNLELKRSILSLQKVEGMELLCISKIRHVDLPLFRIGLAK